jgi:hypothetical protein
MTDPVSITIAFDGSSAAESSSLAHDLSERLQLRLEEPHQINLVKEDRSTLDLGSSIAMILGSQAVIQAIRTLAEYLKYRAGWSDSSEVKIKAGTLELHFKGQPAQRLDVDTIAQEIVRHVGAAKAKGK